MEQAEILAHLKAAGTFFEVFEVRTFKGYRHDQAGDVRDITVEIRDGGVGDPLRYHVVVTDDYGRSVTGKGGVPLGGVIAAVPWDELDREPPP